MAEKRVYEVMYIADPKTTDEDVTKLNEAIEKLVSDEGGEVVKTDDMGVRQMAYKIKQFTQGRYCLFEIEGSGQEIAELERRFRVNDTIFRYITVRVDEERKAAQRIVDRRDDRKSRRKAVGQSETQLESTEQGVEDNE